MLTPDQHRIRRTGIGASEIAAVAGLNPWRSPLDVWLAKPGPDREALASNENGASTTEVGDVLEPAVLELYTRRTGNEATRPQMTYRHPDHSWVLASPDGIVSPELLVEIKVVGARVAYHWDDGVPDYVLTQAHWQLCTMGAQDCDIAALVGGTDFRVYSCKRDETLEAELIQIGREFWENHVLTGEPPPPSVAEDRKAYLRKRFQGGNAEIRDLSDDPIAEQAIRDLIAARDAYKAVAAARDAADAAVMELIGDDEGISGPWGKATWKVAAGGISYKRIAEALAPAGVIPFELREEHRGKPTRKFNFYPAKGGK